MIWLLRERIGFGATMRAASSAIIALLLLAFTDTTAAQHCSDIATVDFRNSTITGVRDVDPPLRFHNGVFNETNGPPTSPFPVEWRYEIIRDTTVRPDPETTIRFIEMTKYHLAGTGSWGYLVGFRCSDGMVENVFPQADEGMRVVSISPDTVQLRFAVWKPSDSHASPLGVRDTWFSWSPSSHHYIETNPTAPADGH